MNLAYNIYCTDTNLAVVNNKDIDQDWIFAFYVTISGIEPDDLQPIYKVGFYHRTFYQYFLAQYIYYSLLNVTKNNAKKYIGYFAERELDYEERAYLSLMLKEAYKETIYSKMDIVFNALAETEGFYNLIPKYTYGNAEKSRIKRATNVYRNVMNLAYSLSYVIQIPFMDKLDNICRTFSGENLRIYSNVQKKADLSGADLRRADLFGAGLRRANLSGVHLFGANLRGANLRETDLRRANLIGANLIGANLIEANLRGAKLRGADLGKADLRKANLVEADLFEANLGEAGLSRANLGEADLRGTNLIRANLRGANLRETDLRRANLRRANLRGADLSRAVLSFGFLSIFDYQEDEPSITDLAKADLSEANLRETDLRRANLIGANLSRANLIEANLRGANLKGADLSKAELSEVNLNRANLIGANLRGANLIGADLSEAELREADLSRANLLRTIIDTGINMVNSLFRTIIDIKYKELIHKDIEGYDSIIWSDYDSQE